MLELNNDRLEFHFPHLAPSATCAIEFLRTLRIPDDNRDYPLPPGLGRFPLFHVDDHAAKLPPAWERHGGVFMPMYRAEAMWLRFRSYTYDCSAKDVRAFGPGIADFLDGLEREGRGRTGYMIPGVPCAVRIAAGKVSAITGEPWASGLGSSPQDYVVAPDQRWVDGFCVSNGLVRQFVAMPMGDGYTAEEQVTDRAEHGGLQIAVHPMQRDRYARIVLQHLEDEFERSRSGVLLESCESLTLCSRTSLGLAPGGLMRQELHEDSYGADAWEPTPSARCFVHLLDATAFAAVTGARPPQLPVSAQSYTDAGLPWFEYYSDAPALDGLPALQRLDSVAARRVKTGEGPLPDNDSVSPHRVVPIRSSNATVREGAF